MARLLSSVMIACAALSAQAQEAAVMTAADSSVAAAADPVVDPAADPAHDDTAIEAGPDTPQEVGPEAAPALIFLDAAGVVLEEYLWTHRPVVVFADTPADPRFREQIKLLSERPAALIDRDVIVITDTDPNARTEVRLKLRPRGFQLALVGKDGRVNLRKPFPWDVREITRAIDKWPLRRDEIRAGTFGQ